MKVKLTVLLLMMGCFLSMSPELQAQNQDRKTWLSLYFGHHEYDGDLGNEMAEFGIGTDWVGGAGLHQYLSPAFDLDLNVTFGVMDYRNDSEEANQLKRNATFEESFLNTNALLRLKLLKEKSAIRPFVATGVGITPFFGGDDDIDSRVAFQIPVQAGFDIRLSDKTRLTLNSTYNRTFADGFDGSDQIDNKDHDDILVHRIGLKFSLGGSKDSDGDGVKDKEDACPQTGGVPALDGCPDQDEDGIADRNDRCPSVAGDPSLEGCPDADGDGVEDNRDACPDVAGDPELDGCPDTDGDGLADNVDRCPDEAGPESLNGCPDSDRDGIVDAEDECPDQAGVEANNGCPEEEQAEMDTTFTNILFELDSSKLDASSEDDIERLAETMEGNQDLTLRIEGHTDSTGTEDYNMELSRERANAVKQSLVDLGVDASRIITTGYGETRPIASNGTLKGRARNRRVELSFSTN